jgi:ribonuclease PH
MIDVGLAGVATLVSMQRGALASAGVELASLFMVGRFA